MGRQNVRVVAVPKPVSGILLVLVTAAMVSLLVLLSGRAYAAESQPIRDLFAWLFGSARDPMSRDAFLVVLMPVIANLLLFMPWGFLAFMVLDSPRRTRRTSYVLTIAGALLFAAAMHAWQQFQPTHVTSLSDVFVNGAGAFAGAALAHARKRVYLRFEVS